MHHYPLLTKRCKFCPNLFTTKRSNKKFCTEKCLKAYYRDRYQKNNGKKYPKRNCPICSKEFQPNFIHHVYCCKDCRLSSRVTTLKASAGNIREYILERDDFTCYKCGEKKTSLKELDTHHDPPMYKGGKDEVEFIRTCCKSCHREEHRLL